MPVREQRELRVAAHLADRPAGDELLVRGEDDIGDRARVGEARQRRRQLEREQPRALVGLERDRVRDALARVRDERAFGTREGGRPAAPVEARHHGTAPVAQGRRRRGTVEVGAQRHRVLLRELRDHARRHRVGQPGGGARGLRQAPQRHGEARKQDEQQCRERQPLHDQLARRDERATRGGGGSRCRAARRQRGERPAEGEHRRRRGGECEGRLPEQERRHHQECGDTEHQRAVARRARLEELDAREHEQERDRRVAPDQVAVRGPHQERGDHREEQQCPRRDAGRGGTGPRAVARGEAHAHHDQRHAEHDDPQRQAERVRQLGADEQEAQPANLQRRQHVDVAPSGGPSEQRPCPRRHRRASSVALVATPGTSNSASAHSASRRCSRPSPAGRCRPGSDSA